MPKDIQSNSDVFLYIVITVNPDSMILAEIQSLVELIRREIGDDSINLHSSTQNTIGLIFSGSLELLEKLQNLLESGKLANLIIVRAVHRAYLKEKTIDFYRRLYSGEIPSYSLYSIIRQLYNKNFKDKKISKQGQGKQQFKSPDTERFSQNEEVSKKAARTKSTTSKTSSKRQNSKRFNVKKTNYKRR